ncbi:sure-like protein [Ganoderma leucocontextum]|nr:sure-like protein [Ganoderma leucocontextum]
MQHWTCLFGAVAVALLFQGASAHNILLTNDDGWAVAQIRAQRDSLANAGFNVILSSPTHDMSGTGSSTATPRPLSTPCQFNTPAGSSAEGLNASDTRLNDVNSFPADAARYGIQTLAPEIFCSPPDLVVSGPNVGNILGVGTQESGTVGAACEATKEGIPSVSFAAGTAGQVSYTTLTTAPHSPRTLSALLYAELSTNFTRTLYTPAARPILPAGVTLKVNYAPTTFSAAGRPVGDCARASDFTWVLTRTQATTRSTDVGSCGTHRLPVEATVVQGGCYAAVTVVNATTKLDVSGAMQLEVLNRLAPSRLFGCFHG